jgi:hypothetical protein
MQKIKLKKKKPIVRHLIEPPLSITYYLNGPTVCQGFRLKKKVTSEVESKVVFCYKKE